MRGCMTTVIFLLVLSGISTFMLSVGALIVIAIEHETTSFADIKWYTYVLVVTYLILFLKLIVKGSRMLSDSICDFLFGKEIRQ